MEKQTIKQQIESRLDGRTWRWFYDSYVYGFINLSYPGMMSQFNGYTSGLSPDLQKIVERFLSQSIAV